MFETRMPSKTEFRPLGSVPFALLPKGPSNSGQTLRAKGQILVHLQQAQREAQREAKRKHKGPIKVHHRASTVNELHIRGENCTEVPGTWATTRSRPQTAPMRSRSVESFSTTHSDTYRLHSASMDNLSVKHSNSNVAIITNNHDRFGLRSKSHENFYIGNGFTGHKRPKSACTAKEAFNMSQIYIDDSDLSLHGDSIKDKLTRYKERLRRTQSAKLTADSRNLKSVSSPDFNVLTTTPRRVHAPANSPEPEELDTLDELDIYEDTTDSSPSYHTDSDKNGEFKMSSDQHECFHKNGGQSNVHADGYPDVIEVSGKCLFIYLHLGVALVSYEFWKDTSML